MGFSNGISKPLSLEVRGDDWTNENREAALAILEKYCLPNLGSDLEDVAQQISELIAPDETRIKNLLLDEVCPKGKYDGMGAWELARMILVGMRRN